MFKPRPMQQEILKFESGRMGVPAVPGSGKTHTLSYLAALLIAKGLIADEQEILIVTLVNSAVNNFATRISQFMQKSGLMQKIGYRVRTLHGLAHDIIKERPDLAGVSEHFTIIDDNEARMILEQITTAYLRDHPEIEDEYLETSIDRSQQSYVQKQWYSLMTDIASSFIRQAKDLQVDPPLLNRLRDKIQIDYPLFDFGLEVFSEYQRGLRFRNSVDFADLTKLALRVLESDEGFRNRLQKRWPYILEDEAQDSSAIQERILRNLVGKNGNWVRVGDTNQAIYDTFTTASPKFLRDFLGEKNVTKRDLSNSGRSNLSIINLANFLIDWSNKQHPVEELRGSLDQPYILPAPADDPQPNPPDHYDSIFINKQPLKPDQEINVVVKSVKKWNFENPGKTTAILCPIGFYAEQVVEALQQAGVEVVELLQSTDHTRKAARLIEKCLMAVSDPSNSSKFANAFDQYMRIVSLDEPEIAGISNLVTQLRKVRFLEGLLYHREEPEIEISKLLELNIGSEKHSLKSFVAMQQRWQFAAALPVDQLLLLMGSDLFDTPQDLALVHKLSLVLEFVSRNHPDYQLPQFIEEISAITRNERKFIGFSDDDNGFNPESHKGKVLVTTYHKSKGLEWDRVYLMSVNNYDFPSLQEYDLYKGEKWFIKEHINLEAELISILKAFAEGSFDTARFEAGEATRESRKDYAAERIRLLYVGITRARESLIITWNIGKRENCTMALPLQAMLTYWENTHAPR